MTLSIRAHRALAGGLAALSLVLAAGCATSRVSPGPSIAETTLQGGDPGRTVLTQSATSFATALTASAADPTSPQKAGAAFTTGRAMLELHCARYLDALGSGNQAGQYERQQVGLIGGLASAIMGTAGSSAREIAVVASSFSFAGSSMDAFANAYLFADASKTVTKIVREAQEAFLDAVGGQLDDLHYDEAVALLARYESLCRPAQIRALIDEAVARGKVVAERPGARLGDPEVASVLTLLRTQLARAVGEEEAILLYAWYRSPQTVRTRIEGAYEVVRTLVAGNPAALEQRLALAFLPVSLAGSPVAARWQPAVDQVVKAVTPVVAPPAGSSGAPLPQGSVQPPGTVATPRPAPVRVLRMPVLTVR